MSEFGREFSYAPRDFQRVQSLIYARAGIRLEASKANMVYSRLARRLRALQIQRFSDYLDALESGHDEDEWQAFINALTTNLTAFFREAHHFEMLAEYLETVPASAKVRIWSSACSTGEEAYSIAMRVVEHYGHWQPNVEIIASDVDTRCLATASAGIYALDKVEALGASRLRQFFHKGRGVHEGKARIKPELARLVQFQAINLLDASYPLQGQFDVIFCRNVMIYFDKPTQRQLVERLAARLKPEGIYFAGHSEGLHHVSDHLRLVRQTAYRRADGVARVLP